MFPDHWKDILGATWQLREFQFVVNEAVQADLARNGVSLDFALEYLKGVAVEFGTHLTIWHDGGPGTEPAAADVVDDPRRRAPTDRARREAAAAAARPSVGPRRRGVAPPSRSAPAENLTIDIRP